MQSIDARLLFVVLFQAVFRPARAAPSVATRGRARARPATPTPEDLMPRWRCSLGICALVLLWGLPGG